MTKLKADSYSGFVNPHLHTGSDTAHRISLHAGTVTANLHTGSVNTQKPSSRTDTQDPTPRACTQ